MRTVLFLIFIILAMGGSFAAGHYLRFSTREVSVTASQILDEARRQIPPPDLPPKPAGRVETTTKTVETHVQTPMVFYGFPPHVTMEERVVKTQVPVQNLVDATPEEIKAWDEKTKSLMDKYEAAVRAKADEIAEQKATEKRKELINEGIDIAKNMVVPVLTSLAGLIGAVVALRAGSKPSLQPRTAEAAPAGSDQTG